MTKSLKFLKITSDSPSQSLSGSSQENVSADVSRHNNDDNLQ